MRQRVLQAQNVHERVQVAVQLLGAGLLRVACTTWARHDVMHVMRGSDEVGGEGAWEGLPKDPLTP